MPLYVAWPVGGDAPDGPARSPNAREQAGEEEGAVRPYPCPYCSVSFKRSQHRARHMLRHTGEQPFLCAHCPARFRRRDVLAVHVKLKHGNVSAETDH